MDIPKINGAIEREAMGNLHEGYIDDNGGSGTVISYIGNTK